MQLLVSLLFFVDIPALVSGTPVQKRGSYKVPRVRNPGFTARNGPRSLAKALSKYHVPGENPLPETTGAELGTVVGKRGLSRSGKGHDAEGGIEAKSTGTGFAIATPTANDVEYLCPVNIGGQIVNLDFDTGSSDLWVFNSQLPSNQTDGRTVFDHTQSDTFAFMQDASFRILYGDGSSAEGTVGTDTVDVGGATVTRQAVSMATAVSDAFFESDTSSGILGLGFHHLSTIKPERQNTFFENVMETLLEPVFTADLNAHEAGAYEFGRIDPSKYVDQLQWVPVDTSRGYWELSSGSFSVDGGEVQPTTHNMRAIVDTGTSLVLTDPDVAHGYYAHIPNSVEVPAVGGFVFPCNETLPDLHLDVGGKMAVIKGKDLNYAQLNDKSKSPCFIVMHS